MHNRHGECFLKSSITFGEEDDPSHGTIACARMHGQMASWHADSNISRSYRLGDILHCNGGPHGSNLDQFHCGALDPVNIRRLWPDSIGHRYARAARSSRDPHALALAVDHQLQAARASGECGSPLEPDPSACVLHIRMGDVFGMTQRTAAELWEGDASGEAFRAVWAERYIQPRIFFERHMRRLPNGTRRVILVANTRSLCENAKACRELGGRAKSASYVRLLHTWLAGRGLSVERHASTLSGHRAVDCDFLFMSTARCFMRSGGSFGRSIAQVVRRRGGIVLSPEEDDCERGRACGALGT